MTPEQLRVVDRITAYLSGGGLFNPELANHDAVRDLLIDARDAHAAALEEVGRLAARVRELEADAARYRCLREPQDHICVEVEEENEDGWTGTFYALVRDELDAAVDAARIKP